MQTENTNEMDSEKRIRDSEQNEKQLLLLWRKKKMNLQSELQVVVACFLALSVAASGVMAQDAEQKDKEAQETLLRR